jgi:hypothetical protein
MAYVNLNRPAEQPKGSVAPMTTRFSGLMSDESSCHHDGWICAQHADAQS